MRAGRYEEALPLLEQAVAGLAGSGELAEAYASYNLAFTRRALGQCDGVVELLDRSEQVQGKRKEISKLRKEAERSCERLGAGEARRVLALVVLAVARPTLDRLPPVAVVAVPGGRVRDALRERLPRRPAELRASFAVSSE